MWLLQTFPRDAPLLDRIDDHVHELEGTVGLKSGADVVAHAYQVGTCINGEFQCRGNAVVVADGLHVEIICHDHTIITHLHAQQVGECLPGQRGRIFVINLAVEQVSTFLEILKDEVFYSENNGGVTFSGGEPLLQIRELEPLLKSLRSKNINICFETSLSVPSDLLEIAIGYIDEIFIDMKILDKVEAKNVLNLDIDLYYENLEIINSSDMNKNNITFRIPLNNEFTLKESNIMNILKCIEKYADFNVEIFKTHNLAESKYKSLNQEFINFTPVDDEALNEIFEKIQEFNSNVKIISLW